VCLITIVDLHALVFDYHWVLSTSVIAFASCFTWLATCVICLGLRSDSWISAKQNSQVLPRDWKTKLRPNCFRTIKQYNKERISGPFVNQSQPIVHRVRRNDNAWNLWHNWGNQSTTKQKCNLSDANHKNLCFNAATILQEVIIRSNWVTICFWMLENDR
jgi:hypothetical protein